MKRKWIALLLALVMVLSLLAGCGGTAAFSAPTAESGKEEPVSAEAASAAETQAQPEPEAETAPEPESERECIDVWVTGRTGADLYHGKLTMEESEEYNRMVSDIATAAAEQSLRFVTGDRSLDEYDSFVEDLRAMGLDRLTEIKQAAYDRYLEA